MVGGSGKKLAFGLSVPKARLGQRGSLAKPAKLAGVFGNDEDGDEDEDGGRGISQAIAAEQRHAHSLAKNEETYRRALKEDPTVFDYDAVYESFNAGKSAKKREDKLSRQSKYIADLKAKAAEREREQEMVHERKMVREVEKEEHLYGAKEKFITSSYRKKLEEDRSWQEQEKRKEEEERRDDVTKKANLGAFYSNLLTSNVAFGNPEEKKARAPREEPAERRQASAAPVGGQGPGRPAEHPPGGSGGEGAVSRVDERTAPEAPADAGPPPPPREKGGPEAQPRGHGGESEPDEKAKAAEARTQKINAALLRYRKRKAAQM
ncbi:DUF2040 domain-containing protein [Chloropicon primus]|uniref:DUF2040 domain-containing protein n=1 Tax=Chloropicon primus TaxID=1764295 RepID=A0A5B8MF71_9CHLO|nr:DUF2040 domain-containing protein [Chloropicon primus]UPQ97207.1 DUF2040 domain-containing protein [Chloropicon primus]|eukprot:QDZ17992.1 DUF2040 domain-containing protein [Chloropicon primus]